MFAALLSPAFAPFTIAFFLVIGLLLVEIATLLIGKSASSAIEGLFEGDLDGGGLSTVFDWVNPAGVPLLVYLVIFATLFGGIGFGVQSLAGVVAGELSPWLAVPIAGLLTLPVARGLSRFIGRLIPAIETYALDQTALMGQAAEVTVGPVRAGAVARVKLKDASGNWHFPKVEPMNPLDVIPEGAMVVVVESAGTVLKVVPAEMPAAPQAQVSSLTD